MLLHRLNLVRWNVFCQLTSLSFTFNLRVIRTSNTADPFPQDIFGLSYKYIDKCIIFPTIDTLSVASSH